VTLEEICLLIGRNLVVTRYANPGPGNHWAARIQGAEIKDGGMLRAFSGRGVTPDEALIDYANEIAGKVLVFDAYNDRRREINIPKGVSA
jgi:hypothetical protein